MGIIHYLLNKKCKELHKTINSLKSQQANLNANIKNNMIVLNNIAVAINSANDALREAESRLSGVTMEIRYAIRDRNNMSSELHSKKSEIVRLNGLIEQRKTEMAYLEEEIRYKRDKINGMNNINNVRKPAKK